MAEIVTQQPVELPSMAGYFFRVLISLIVIIILTYLIINLIKKQNDFQQKQKSWIRIIDYQALGANRGIYLVDMLSAIYVLGVSEGQINILKEIDPNDDNWLIIRENLEQRDVLPLGLVHKLKEGLKNLRSSKEPDNGRFKDQLEQQIKRSHRLYRQYTGGEGDGEN